MPRAYVIQDRETRCFLALGEDGDVIFTPWITEAGQIFDDEEAFDTAQLNCNEGFIIFSFFIGLSS